MSNDAGAAGQAPEQRGGADGTRARAYHERLYVAWWAWPLPLVAAAIIAAQVHMGYPGVRAWLPYVVAIPLVAVLLAVLGRALIQVTVGDDDQEPELRAGEARLPVRFVGRVEMIGKPDKRKALGPELDPAAFVLHRAWVGTLLRVHLTDPDDPTPYWLLSTRRPEQLARALGRA